MALMSVVCGALLLLVHCGDYAAAGESYPAESRALGELFETEDPESFYMIEDVVRDKRGSEQRRYRIPVKLRSARSKAPYEPPEYPEAAEVDPYVSEPEVDYVPPPPPPPPTTPRPKILKCRKIKVYRKKKCSKRKPVTTPATTAAPTPPPAIEDPYPYGGGEMEEGMPAGENYEGNYEEGSGNGPAGADEYNKEEGDGSTDNEGRFAFLPFRPFIGLRFMSPFFFRTLPVVYRQKVTYTDSDSYEESSNYRRK